ncbi:MAG TPA: YcaO-like family protein [Polyangia bacterium]|jgi:ribosomal protein S12 methylthiotransferase accessory factor|nr:YcaO-like family protein [Polyangia bacterium]
MSQTLMVTYRQGTHRLLPPEQTLARLSPHLIEFGITRCADVTRLDEDLGMPVFMAIRPRGRVFQSSAGKGLHVTAAKVSALMEAVELDVAERPAPTRLRRASRSELLAEGHRVDALPEWAAAAGRFFSDRFRIGWTLAEDLLHGGEVWVPAGAAYFCEPTPCRTNTNGLASGNHLIEATLHGLYEVIERDAVARLVEGDRLAIGRHCRVIAPTSVSDSALAAVIQKIQRANTKVVLLQVLSGLAVPTYWALLLNRQPFAGISTLNAGYGTHLDGTVALSRALSEAVQSRLTLIHGSRDDIVEKPVYTRQAAGGHATGDSPAFRFFDALEPTAPAVAEAYDGDFHAAFQQVLSLLRQAGHERVYRVDLRCPVPDFSVVKILTPSLMYHGDLM